MKKIILILVIFATAAGCVKTPSGFMAENKQPGLPASDSQGNQSSTTQAAQTGDTNLDTNCLKNKQFGGFALNSTDINDPNSDEQLLKINTVLYPNCVVIKSLRAAVPELKQNPAYYLGSTGQLGKYYIFDVRMRPKYTPLNIFYRLDISTGIFTRLLNINSLTTDTLSAPAGSCGDDTQVAHLIYVPNKKAENGNNKNIYLLDLISDSYKIIATVNDRETLNAGSYQDPRYDILCSGADHIITYAVYEFSGDANLNKPLKQYRQVKF